MFCKIHAFTLVYLHMVYLVSNKACLVLVTYQKEIVSSQLWCCVADKAIALSATHTLWWENLLDQGLVSPN